MALPMSDRPWPPLDATITEKLAEWSAWYGGEPKELRGVYARQGAARVGDRTDRPAQYQGGVVGAIARMWWGRPIGALGSDQRVDQLHVPIAADICQASADLLYSEAPILRSTDKAMQERLEELADDGLHTTLASGAEVGAALGGRYHRVSWDRELSPKAPFVTTVDADAAYPEFRYDRLVAVTFSHVLRRDNGRVWRHLERHELVGGLGHGFHGLYEGSSDKLGRPVPLTEFPATERLANDVDADGALKDGRTPGLLVRYFPNQRPTRIWRHHPVGKSFGRSDLAGVEPLMDALDEAYSSWMRDLRLAKSRVFIPDYMLKANGPGRGASYDLDQEVYVPVKSAAPEDADAKITLNQFKIRVEEHERTTTELTQVILRAAGYSAQTFGETSEGANTTATEVRARERRSYLTRDRKSRLERPELEALMGKLVSIDAALFNGKAPGDAPVNVEFGDYVQEGPLQLAQTAQSLSVARAASTKTLVELVHPDWDETQVNNEVELIKGDSQSRAVDPFGFQG